MSRRKKSPAKFRLTSKVERNCADCPLHKHPEVYRQVTTEYYPLPGIKPSRVDVMFIAEAPGASENSQGRPFIGRSGRVLRRTVMRLCDNQQVGCAYGNIVRCRPTRRPRDGERGAQNRPPSQKESRLCQGAILKDIERLKPKVLVLLGDTAAKNIARNRDGSTIDPKTKVNEMRGHHYIVRLPSGREVPAVVTYHFSHVYRTPNIVSVFREDVGKAIRRVHGQLGDYSERAPATVVLDTIPKVKRYLGRLVKGLTKDDVVAFDYETKSLDRIDNTVLCCSFSYGHDESTVIPLKHPEAPWSGPEYKQVMKLLRKFLRVRNPSFRALVPHNLKFEALATLDQFGTHILLPMEDTQQRAHALNEDRKDAVESPYSLKALCEQQLGFYGYLDDDIAPVVRMKDQGRLDEVALDAVAQYNGMDAYVTYRLWRWQEEWAAADGYLDRFKLVSHDLHGPVAVVAAEMERNGLLANKDSLIELMADGSEIQTRMREIQAELYSLDTVKQANRVLLKKKGAGGGAWGGSRDDAWLFKLTAPASKHALFFDVLNLEAAKISRKTKTKSVGKELFEKYEGIQEIELFAEYGNLRKVISTYVKGIHKILLVQDPKTNPDIRDGRVRPHFKPTGTITGRLSSANPNMLNIPARKKDAASKAIKRLYIVPPGYCMVIADYSQAEVRWLAEATNDPFLVKAFRDAYEAKRVCRLDPTPENKLRSALEGDFHKHTASMINKVTLPEVTKQQRSAAKCVHPDTLVFTDRPVQFKHLVEFGGAGEARPVRANVAVNTGSGAWTAVTTSYNDGVKEMVHVVSRRGLVTCSREHRFALADGSLRRAGDLQKGDRLVESVLPLVEEKEFVPISVRVGYGVPDLQYLPTLETAYFAGMYLGDGVKCSQATVGVAHGHIDKTDRTGTSYKVWQDIIVDAVQAVGLETCGPRDELVYIGGRHVMRWMQALELMTSENNSDSLEGESRRGAIPQWVLSAGRSALLSFLGGLYDTDGCVSKGSLSVTTKHPSFAGHIITVLRHLGFHPSMDPSWNKTYKRYYYRVRLPVGESGHFKKWIRHPGKRARLKPTYDVVKQNRLRTNKVLVVIDAGDGPCYDVTVDAENHLYCTNGLITHNTIMFGLVYGMTEQGLASRLSAIYKRKVSVKEALAFIETFFARFPVAKKWLDQMEQNGFRNGFVVSPTGRRKLINSWILVGNDDLNRLPKHLGYLKSNLNHEMRVCRNAPIQGVASDTNLLACSQLLQHILQNQLDWKIINSVYDSIMIEVPFPDARNCIETAQTIMEDPRLFEPFGLRPKVPFAADFSVGVNWGDQFDIAYDSEAWDVSCQECGSVRSEKRRPNNQRCEECGSRRVRRRITEGPMDMLLRQIDKDHGLSEVWG